MKIDRIPFDDTDEELGYSYVGILFIVQTGETTAKLRAYDSRPTEVSFMTLNDKHITKSKAQSPVFDEIKIEMQKLGFTQFKVLLKEGYFDLNSVQKKNTKWWQRIPFLN